MATAVLSGVVAGTTPAAASSYHIYVYPLTTKLAVTHPVAMIAAGGRLFVAQGAGSSAIAVFSTAGVHEHDIAGEPGVSSLAVSADGRTVYAVRSVGTTNGEVSAINVATLAHKDVAIDPCPTSLAVTSGRVFYSYGCGSTSDSSGVSSIDPASSAAPVTALIGLSAPPTLGGGGTTLVVDPATDGKSTVVSYRADASGGLTGLSSRKFSTPVPVIAVSADGSTVAFAAPGGYGAGKYSTATFHALHQGGGGDGDTSAIALSPNGDNLLVGDGDNENDDLLLLAGPTGTYPRWNRTAVTPVPATWEYGVQARVVPASLTFSREGNRVYGLIAAASGGVFLFSSDVAIARTTLHMSFKDSNNGQHATAMLRLSTAGTIDVLQTWHGHPLHVVGSVRTNREGLATVPTRLRYSGEIQYAFEGSGSYAPTAATQEYDVPSTVTVSMSGAYGSSGEEKLLHHASDARFVATVTPVATKNRHVRLILERKVDGHWYGVGKAQGRTTKSGKDRFGLGRVFKHREYRIKVAFAGDRYDGQGFGWSPAFEIV